MLFVTFFRKRATTPLRADHQQSVLARIPKIRDIPCPVSKPPPIPKAAKATMKDKIVAGFKIAAVKAYKKYHFDCPLRLKSCSSRNSMQDCSLCISRSSSARHSSNWQRPPALSPCCRQDRKQEITASLHPASVRFWVILSIFWKPLIIYYLLPLYIFAAVAILPSTSAMI